MRGVSAGTFYFCRKGYFLRERTEPRLFRHRLLYACAHCCLNLSSSIRPSPLGWDPPRLSSGTWDRGLNGAEQGAAEEILKHAQKHRKVTA